MAAIDERRIRHATLNKGNIEKINTVLGGIDTNALSNAFVTTEKQEMSQWNISSGILGCRQYTSSTAFEPTRRTIDAPYAALNIHNHPNYYGMCGMAELALSMNGIYYRSRHNDYRMAENVVSVDRRAPHIASDYLGHNHYFYFVMTERQARDLIAGNVATVTLETGINNRDHVHLVDVTWNGTNFVAVQQADATGHTHVFTPSSQGDQPKSNRRDYIQAPDLRSDIAALPTGVTLATGAVDTVSNTQAKYLSEIWTNDPQDIEMTLSYAEMWFELIDPELGVPDAGDSFRHAELAGQLTEAYRRSTFLSASGHKNLLENISLGPALIVGVTEDGAPIYANPVFRISCKKVGNMGSDIAANRVAPGIVVAIDASHGHQLEPLTDQEAKDLRSGAETVIAKSTLADDGTNHVHTYDITWDGNKFVGTSTDGFGHVHDLIFSDKFNGTVPFNKQKAIDGVEDSTNKFTLVRDLQSLSRENKDLAQLIDSRRARFRVKDLDRMCELCPGLDGEGSALIEQHTNPYTGDVDTLTGRDDSSVELNAAYYNRRYSFGINDASGRVNADRGFNDNTLFVAKTTNENVINGTSYMFPLELIARTPVEKWNPLGVPHLSYVDLKAEETAGKGIDVGTPYTGVNYQHFWFRTPFGFYGDPENAGDPADTAATAFVHNANGVSLQCWASGTSVFTHDYVNRLRYPVYPLAQEFSYESGQTANLKEMLKLVLEDIRAGTATAQSIQDAF